AGAHGPLGHEPGQIETGREMAAPIGAISACQAAQSGRRPLVTLPPNQTAAQEPGRLQSDADPFRDDRMGLARGVADQKNTVLIGPAQARPQRTGGQAGPGSPSACQDPPRAEASFLDVSQDRGARVPPACPTYSVQLIPAHTTRETDTAPLT